MTDFLGRVLGEPDPTAIRPRLPSRFEPGLELEPPAPAGPDRRGGTEIAGGPPARPAWPPVPPAPPVDPAEPGAATAVRATRSSRSAEPAPPLAPAAVPLLGALDHHLHRDRAEPREDRGRTTAPQNGADPPVRPWRAAAEHGRPSAFPQRQADDRAVHPARATPAAGHPVAVPPGPAVHGAPPRSAASRNPGAARPLAGETTVHVSIGRVEVRAEIATPPPRRTRQTAPALGLDEYLRGRAGGGGP